MRTSIALAASSALAFLACGPKPAAQDPSTAKPDQAASDILGTPVTEKLAEGSLPDNLYFNVEVEGFGLVVVKLFTEDAPKNVTNVANLGISGFYDGLTFHRIIEGFVVQGGDPEGTGNGGPGYDVAAEIGRLHDKGCMAMARESDDVNPDRLSSGSQFYFCLEPLAKLDGKYTVIGQIVEGLDVMEAMGKVPTDQDDKPLEDVIMKKVTVTTD